MKKRNLLWCVALLPLLTGCGGEVSSSSPVTSVDETDYATPLGKTYSFDDFDVREKGIVVRVSNEAELFSWANKVNAGEASYLTSYVELTSDIALTGEWTPVDGFQGQFNGNGHSISGLSIHSSKTRRGFFSSLDGAKVGCLDLYGEVEADENSGILAGFTTGEVTLLDIKISGTLLATNYAGGLVGSMYGGSLKIVGCINASRIRGAGYLGGLLGANKTYKVNFTDCANYGSVEATGAMVGGIAASVTQSTTEPNDYNLVDCFHYGTVKGTSYIGGVIGLSCVQLHRCGVGEGAKVVQIGKEEVPATTLTSFVSPFCSLLAGSLLYNVSINQYGEMIECENEYGFAITGIHDPAGCTRMIKFKDKVMLFAATNKYAVSEDGGHTFGPFTTVSGKAEEICPIDGQASTDTGNTQPWVLEDGRIAMFYRAIRRASSFSYGSLRMRISDENGVFDASDKPITLIENYTRNTGTAGAFYEPYPILLDDGTYAIYISEDVHFSDPFTSAEYHVDKLREDLIAPGGSQNTVMIPLSIAPNATELGKGKIEIGDPVLVFKGSDTTMFGHANSRPGMTVVTQLYDGSYAMILENSTEQQDPGYNLVVQITYSRDGLTWTNPKTIIRPHRNGGERNEKGVLFKTCSPFITTLPDGRVVFVCATDEDYKGGFPSDDAHYKHEIAFLSKDKVGYGDDLSRDQDMIQLGNYTYSENEYCVWASVACLDGTIYVSGLQGVNYYKPDGTLASPTDLILISSIHYQKLYSKLGIAELQ